MDPKHGFDIRCTQRERWYRLLGILQEHAPTGSDQMKCAEMVWRAQGEGMNDFSLERMLTNALADGLNHNNWPWMPLAEVINSKAAKCPACLSPDRRFRTTVETHDGSSDWCNDDWHLGGVQ